MKQLNLILLVIVLTACASSSGQYKTDKEMMREAAQIEMEKGGLADGERLKVTVLRMPSHGFLGDQLARLVEGRDAKNIAQLLLALKKAPEPEVLLYVTNTSAEKDYRLLARALEGLQLEGVKFFLAARADYKEAFENLIKPSGADFLFIDTWLVNPKSTGLTK